MAMDKTATRRMIGAIVLVLVAALVLAFLLKGKSNKPETELVQDVTLPSSPILAFPGDGASSAQQVATGDSTANIQQVAAEPQTADPDATKAGLDMLPNGLKPAADAVKNAAAQTPQNTPKSVNVADATANPKDTANTPDSKGAAAKSSRKDLKKNDIVNLGNDSKVNSDDAKSSDKDKKSKSSDSQKKDQKKPKGPKPKLVNEKRLPKVGDKRKKSEVAKKSLPSSKPDTSKADTASDSTIPTTGFSVQLLATGAESKADAVKTQMIDEGYPAYVTSVINNGKTLYRVRVGSYQDHDEADSVQARMKRRYSKNSNVQNSLVVAN